MKRFLLFIALVYVWSALKAAPIFSVDTISEDEFLAGITDKSDKNLSLKQVTNLSLIHI